MHERGAIGVALVEYLLPRGIGLLRLQVLLAERVDLRLDVRIETLDPVDVRHGGGRRCVGRPFVGHRLRIRVAENDKLRDHTVTGALLQGNDIVPAERRARAQCDATAAG